MTYTISNMWMVALIVGVLWELFWKGMAMWRAALLDEPVWFTAMLVVNSVGIVPIFYLLTHHEYRHSQTTKPLHKGGLS